MQISMLLGVLFSWLSALVFTFLVGFLASRNRSSKNYEGLGKSFEKSSYVVNTVVLLYLGIHLASKALTSVGVPYLGENYSKLNGLHDGGIWKSISPQDVFLTLFAFFVIFLIFWLAPWLVLKSKRIAKLSSIRIVNSSFIISFFVAIILAWWLNSIVSSVTITVRDPSTLDTGEEIWFFVLLGVASFFALITHSYYVKNDESVNKDFSDLLLSLSLIPALIIGPLVRAGDDLLKYDNYGSLPGNIVVGVIIISGFLTFAFVAKMFSRPGASRPPYGPLLCALFCSLAAISFSALAFLIVGKRFELSVPDYVLSLPVAFMLVILPYEVFYERVWKYQFGQWWPKQRTYLLVISVGILMLVAPMKPSPIKSLNIVVALIILVFLPFIIRLSSFKSLFKRPLLKQFFKRPYWGFVLLKVNPGQVENVIEKIAKVKGVYNPMIVTGINDVIATIEATDIDDFTEKIFELRKINGVKTTDTAKDLYLEGG